MTVFTREGNPEELVSDNGPQFISAEFSEFLRERNISHFRSAVYYPRANGEVERFNRVLKECLQTASIQGEPWKTFTQTFLMDYRSTPHATTGVTPSELLHGRCMRTKLQIMDFPVKETDRNVIREHVRMKQDKVKRYTDARRNAKPSRFQPGDRVRVKKPWMVKKGDRKFTHPKAVVRKKGEDSYLLDDGKVWNASRLAEIPKSSGSVTPTEVQHGTTTSPLDRSVRVRQKPVWTKDYVLDV